MNRRAFLRTCCAGLAAVVAPVGAAAIIPPSHVPVSGRLTLRGLRHSIFSHDAAEQMAARCTAIAEDFLRSGEFGVLNSVRVVVAEHINPRPSAAHNPNFEGEQAA